jgi:hypothetical protein
LKYFELFCLLFAKSFLKNESLVYDKYLAIIIVTLISLYYNIIIIIILLLLWALYMYKKAILVSERTLNDDAKLYFVAIHIFSNLKKIKI